MLVVRLLGQFDVRVDDAPVEISLRSAQSLFAYLILTAGKVHRREHLAGLFWPEASEPSARQSLRQALWHLRRAFPPANRSCLLADNQSVSFDAQADFWLDVTALQRVLDENAPTDAHVLAVSAYGGELLPGFYDDWVALEREHLAAVFEQQMQRLLERLTTERAWPVVLTWAEKWLSFGQVPEPAYRALLLAHAGLGDLAGVAAAYQRCVNDLDRELGVTPSDQTRSLFEQLRQGRSPADARPTAPGLEARYDLQAEIGRGSMGVVHRAYDRLLERTVAIKLLSPAGLGTSGRARLMREAQAAARLQHAHIVAVFDAGEFNGTPAIVMELVDGRTLDQPPPLAVAAVLRLGAEIAGALEHAHQQGVLHRDVKPGNIVLGPTGSAKLMDFGLAYSASSPLTQDAPHSGTALYMAPELLRGERATTLSDLYALGATLYELVAGRPPFVADALPAVISQHLHVPAAPPSTYQPMLPAALDDLIVQLLGKAPTGRPASAGAVRVVLERLAQGEAVAVEAPAPGKPPYRGLQAFDEPDAAWFFGRERVVARLAGRLREPAQLVVVVGASGSGKSSVVRAGLLPALRSGAPLADGTLPPAGSSGWHIHVITPTAHPLEALAVSLTAAGPSVAATLTLMDDLAADPRSLHVFLRRHNVDQPDGERRLLVVDQFEELFTLCRDEDERQAFVNNLLYAASIEAGGLAVVVLTLRADFYGHCAAYPNLREALASRQEYIGPLSADELRQVIDGPAQRGGWRLEDGLVELLLKDAGDEPGALPLLSHALLETWQRRRGRTLTLRGYTTAGGVRGAIAQTAETVYGQLSTGQQAIARSLFLRLTELGEGTQDTRRRVHRAELVPAPDAQAGVDTVLQLLSQARLVTLGKDTVEVAHEALIREWPTLRRWLQENRDGLRLHRHLTEAAAEWQRRRRDSGELYRGARLAQVVEWASFSSRGGDLNALEREFLAASQAAAEQAAAEQAAQRQRELEAALQLAETAQRMTATAEQLTLTEQRRSREQASANRQLRRLAVGLTLLLLLAAVAGGLAWQQSLRAQREARLARAQAWAAESVNQLTVDPERSIWLALHALAAAGQPPLPKAEEALHRAVQSARLLLTLPHPDGPRQAAFTADGHRLVTVDAQGVVRVWDLAGRAEQVPYELRLPKPAGPLALSADGTRVAVADVEQKSLAVWSVLSGEQQTLSVSVVARTLAFSPDGSLLAANTMRKTIEVWEVATGRHLRAFPAVAAHHMVFNRNASRLALIASDRNQLVVLEAETGQTVSLPRGDFSSTFALAFSPDGGTLAAAGLDGTVQQWRIDSGGLVGSAVALTSPGVLAYSPEEQHLAVSQSNGVIHILDSGTGRLEYQLLPHTNLTQQLTFSPDGARLASVNADGTVKVWNTTRTVEWRSLNLPDEPDAAGSVTDIVEDVVVGLGPLPGQIQVAATVNRAFRLTPALSKFTNAVFLWDLTTGRLLRRVPQPDAVERVALSGDGSLLATANSDGMGRLWDTQTAAPLRAFVTYGKPGKLDGIAFYPGWQRLALGKCDGSVTVWDLATDEVSFTVETGTDETRACGYGDWTDVEVSADGRLLAATGPGASTRLIDAATGQLRQILGEHQATVYGLALSPDGRWLATGDDDAVILVWDTHNAQPRYRLIGHTQGVPGLAFSPDGSLLASASWDGLTKLWDMQTGREKFTLFGSGQELNTVAFTPDGRFVVVAGNRNSLQVFAVHLDDLVMLARARVTRPMSVLECQQYLRLPECPPLP